MSFHEMRMKKMMMKKQKLLEALDVLVLEGAMALKIIRNGSYH